MGNVMTKISPPMQAPIQVPSVSESTSQVNTVSHGGNTPIHDSSISTQESQQQRTKEREKFLLLNKEQSTGATTNQQKASESVLNYHVDVTDRLLPPAELEKMVEHAVLAQTIYEGTLQDNLQEAKPFLKGSQLENWESMPIPENLLSRFKEACPDLQKLDDDRFIDKKSGLVMQVFQNPKTQHVALAFGGTSAGEHKATPMGRVLENPGIFLTQWLQSNLPNTLGTSIPHSYTQAADLAGLVVQHLNGQEEKKKWTVSLTGHSKGGAEAEYAALKNGLPAVCFGTPELSETLLNKLSKSQLESGMANIKHYLVNGDLVPNTSNGGKHAILPNGAHVGSCFWMEPTPEVGRVPLLNNLWDHVLFFHSALHEADKENRLRETNPSSSSV